MSSPRPIALVTAGMTRVSLATARTLHDLGFAVLVTGQTPETREAWRLALPEGIAVLPAARSLVDAARLADQIAKRFGALDAAVLQAGIGRMLPIDAVDEATFDEHFAVDVKGQYLTLQTVLPLMRHGGSVIFNAAIGAHKGVPNGSVYTAAKGALLAMVRSLAVELAPRGIRINSVSPGPANNATFDHLGLPTDAIAALRETVSKRVPLGRCGADDEIAEAIAFLASPASSLITGADIAVDGAMAAA